jgi:isochorismate synthase
MHLVNAAEVADLRSQLGSLDGLRLASINVDLDPFDFARTGAALVDRAVAYSTPWGDRLVGIGTAWHATASGPDRFAEIKYAVDALDRPDLKVFFGYAFRDERPDTSVWESFEAAEAFVPRIGMDRTGGRSTLTVVIPKGEDPEATLDLLASMRHPDQIPIVDPGDHSIESLPHISEWAQSVSDAVKVIVAGELDKVVLTRAVRVDSSEPVAILRVFRELVASYPECYNFAWKSGDSVFMGASPELLVRIEAGVFRSNPLAGSAGRGEGEQADDRIGQELVASSKDQEEHRLVVDDMRSRLNGLVDDLLIPESPALKKMATVQHLSTVIEGTMARGVGILDVIGAVHPTPAVGGVPRDAAMALIDDAEHAGRGWYTGGIGYVTPSGEGAIAIGLRCGVVRDATTHLFAGAGIVADSQPEAELAETRLKLRPLLDILAAT